METVHLNLISSPSSYKSLYKLNKVSVQYIFAHSSPLFSLFYICFHQRLAYIHGSSPPPGSNPCGVQCLILGAFYLCLFLIIEHRNPESLLTNLITSLLHGCLASFCGTVFRQCFERCTSCGAPVSRWTRSTTAHKKHVHCSD